MRIQLFTIEKANRMIAEIRPEVDDLVRLHADHARAERDIAVLQMAVSGASPENPDALSLRMQQERTRRLEERLQAGIDRIQRRGPVIKDLERGLVDFYALAGDRLVFLCWQAGETEVGHWHTLEGGFASRQRIQRSESDR